MDRRIVAVLVVAQLVASCGPGDGPTQVEPPPTTPVATTITLSTASLTLVETQTGQLSATVLDQNGAVLAGATVTWTSSAEGVASVSSAGLVTAVGGGSATVTATSGAASRAATVSVEALAATTVVVSSSTLSLLEGETVQLSATVTDQLGNDFLGATVDWESSDPSVATVSSDGLVTALKEGQVTVSASVGSVEGQLLLDVDDGPGPWTIDTSLNLVPVPAGEQVTIPVYAIDEDTRESVPFTASGGSPCVNLTQTATGIVLTGVAQVDCEASITISAEDQTKTIRVQSYVPYLFPLGGGLYMAYANSFTRVWGVGASTNGYAWHPNVAAPYYPVGDHFTTDATDPATLDNVPAVILLDLSPGGNALAAPTTYDRIWTDYKTDDCVFTNCGRSATKFLWRPVCPVGYKALGSVATATGTLPSTDLVRCVADQYTVPAEFRGTGTRLWTDAGSGADQDALVWAPRTAASTTPRTDDKTTMFARSFVACNSSGSPVCDESGFNLLLVPIPVVMEGNDRRDVALSDPAGFEPQQKGVSRFRVPFTLIPSEDPTCGTAECATAVDRVAANMMSPFVYLEKYDAWTAITAPLDCRTCVANATLTATYEEFFEVSRANSFSKTLGLSVTVGADAKFLGAGGSVEVTVSTEFGWTETTSRTYGTTSGQSYAFPVAPGTVGQIVQVNTLFRGVNEAGQVIGTPFSANSRDLVKYVSWRPTS